MDLIESKNRYKLYLEQDADCSSPRENDNLGIMACFHRRYKLGDKHNLSIEEVQAIAASPEYLSLPIYIYDHGGITINTSGFSCPWDSGQLGRIYVSREKLKSEGLSHRTDSEILQYLKNEVETYDQFLTGDCWGYIIKDADGDTVDSCWGFIGEKHAIEEAKSAFNYYANKQLELSV